MKDVPNLVGEVWRSEGTRLVAAIARVTGDISIAEELAQDALAAAVEAWPRDGVPQNPGAWLTATAKRRGIDVLRRRGMLARKHEQLAREQQIVREYDEQRLTHALEQDLCEGIDDDVLRLIFTACHPVVTVEGRIALALRLICGLTTSEIARAFLVPERTMGQRIFRAKKALSEAGIPYATPSESELPCRLESVLLVIYLIFNEGYTATSGEDWARPTFCDEALRLGRLMTRFLPEESEVHALLALMELQASRARARLGRDGEAVLLSDQDRSLWDYAQIRRGQSCLELAERLGGEAKPYALQAAIADCHARALTMDDTDWVRVVCLYDALMQIQPSPVVALNRAVAVGMSQGAAAGLNAVDGAASLAGHSTLSGYHLFHSVRGDLLMKLGRLAEARQEIGVAIKMTMNLRERELLKVRLKRMEL